MSRNSEILLKATGIDYAKYSDGPLVLDYEAMMAATGYSDEAVESVQSEVSVGRTPMLELRNISEFVRSAAPAGQGARIFLKDEAANPSGSFKDRRASISAHRAAAAGYAGLIAATSGNYGAAVASQAAIRGLRAIVIQEAFDSQWRGQPEILEKTRKCEALGAEVIQTTVGPELFYLLLSTLEETGYFNASLYTPFSVQGIQTLGREIVRDVRARTGKEPAAILATHAGGGMCTGIGRGMRAEGATDTELIAVSVNLQGLHMASDHDFNRKSFTTGHTGFSMPFTTWPDRSDVPRNAARPLRYLDRFVTVTQGAVFYATELLAQLEGIERGPAGNTSLAAALIIAQQLPADASIVVSETEYTGAGKTPWAQLAFAEEMGVRVVTGKSDQEIPGQVIALPLAIDDIGVSEVDLRDLRMSYLRGSRRAVGREFTAGERAFLTEDGRISDGDWEAWERASRLGVSGGVGE